MRFIKKYKNIQMQQNPLELRLGNQSVVLSTPQWQSAPKKRNRVRAVDCKELSQLKSPTGCGSGVTFERITGNTQQMDY